LADDFLINVEIDFKNAEQSARRMAEVLARFNAEVDSPALKRAEKNLASYAAGVDKAGNAAKKMEQSLSTTRYAMFSTGATLGIVSAALIGVSVAAYGTAIAFERNFANVVRTSAELRSSAEATRALRADFIDLAQTLPTSFQDLTQIGTLGNQLGVTADNLAGFTRTVAQFSTVTGMTVDATATAFGRLDSLLPGVEHNYNGLGSAILAVGVNSVSTEGEITKTSVQISAMSNQAGLAADEVIGLAGAFASVGVQPELARGTVTRLFSEMGKAAKNGGERLEGFAKISGVSAEQFAQGYGKPGFGDIFLSFMKGIAAQGTNANATLQALGINSVRDRPALINLANASDSLGRSFIETNGVAGLLQQTLDDARKGFAEGTEVYSQYGVITDTVAAKLQILGNNFQVFLDAAGQGSLGPLGGVLDLLSSFLKTITALTSTPWGQWVAGGTVALIGLMGALAGIGAAAALSMAGIIGMQQALVGLGGAAAMPGLLGLRIQLLEAGGAGITAARGLRLAELAVKGLGIAMATVGFVALADGVIQGIKALNGWGNNLDDVLSRIHEKINKYNLSEELSKVLSGNDFDAQINRAFGTHSINPVLSDLAAADEQLAQLAKTGQSVNAANELQYIASAFTAAGASSGEFTAYMTDTISALKASGYEIKQNSQGIWEIIPPTKEAAAAVGALGTAEEIAAQAAAEAEAAHRDLADSLGLSEEQLKSFESSLSSSSAGFLSLDDTLQRTQDKAKAFAQAQADASTDATDSWENFYDGSSISLEKFMQTLDEQIAEQQGWADSIAILVSKGAINAAQAMAEGGPKMADAAKQLAEAPLDELEKADEKFYLRGQLTTDAFGQGLTASIPALQDAGAKGGDAAVVALENAMLTGSPSAVAAVVAQFNLDSSLLPIQFQSKLSEPALTAAEGNLQAFSTRPRSPIEIGSEMSQPGLNATEGNLQAFRTAPRSPIEIGSRMNQPGLNATEGTLQAFRTAPRSPIEVGSEMNQPGLNRTEGTLQAFKNRPRTAIIDTEARTAAAESALNYLARSRTVTYTVQTVGSVQAVVGSNGQQITGIVGKATGGYIRGPGSGTSDSIPARLSNGEYVIRAATVRQYGVGFFDSINRGAAKFAQGGYVRGYAAGGAVSAGSNIVQLSPYDRRLLSIIADKSGVVIGHDVLANAANASNLNAAARRNN
jgi:TP901 family phage tail tape measure protein